MGTGLPLFVELAPFILSIVEVLKRFIPNELRNIANPTIAVVLGLGFAYLAEGEAGLVRVGMDGLLAAGTAVGAYKIPKVAGQALKIN